MNLFPDRITDFQRSQGLVSASMAAAHTLKRNQKEDVKQNIWAADTAGFSSAVLILQKKNSISLTSEQALGFYRWMTNGKKRKSVRQSDRQASVTSAVLVVQAGNRTLFLPADLFNYLLFCFLENSIQRLIKTRVHRGFSAFLLP